MKGCMKLVNERGVCGFRMHKLKQEELIKFMRKYPDISITLKEVYLVLFEIRSVVFDVDFLRCEPFESGCSLALALVDSLKQDICVVVFLFFINKNKTESSNFNNKNL